MTPVPSPPKRRAGRVVSIKRGQGHQVVRPPPEERQKITLMMLSGGFDSVYFLYKLLTETEDYIFAHHINLVNPEGRHREEQKACRAIVDWLRANVRQFEYGETTIMHEGLPVFGYDMVSVGFEAGVISHSIFGSFGRMPDRWIVGTCTEEGSNPERWVHVENCVAANCFPQKPPPFDSLPIVTKAEEIAALPPELRNLVWYCRRPVRDGDISRPCGKCTTCITVKEAYDALGESTQQVGQ
ncbi:MAG: hypothetical protein AAF220_03375 [Pseudomonadota bacterium]